MSRRRLKDFDESFDSAVSIDKAEHPVRVEEPAEQHIDFVDHLHLKERAKTFALSLFPPREWLPQYNLEKLKFDIVAAVSVIVMLIPQAIAYSSLAGLPPQYGIWGAQIPLLVYALFGTSRQLAIGPVALVSLLTFESLEAIGLHPGTPEYNSAATLLAFMAGCMQIIMGFAQLGVLVTFLAHPVLAGFMTAAGFVIGTTQLTHLFGISLESQPTIFQTIYQLFKNIGDTRYPTLIVGVCGIVILLILKICKKKFPEQTWLKLVPGALIVVVLFTVICYAAGLYDLGDQSVAIVGAVEATYPDPSALDFSRFADLVIPAVLVSIVGFMESVSLASAMAEEHDYKINASQELVALGLADLVGALFSSMAVTGSLGRSALANSAGARTQMYGFFCGLLALAGGAAVPLLKYLPRATLAAIILVACISLVKFKEMVHLWHTDKRDFLVMIVTVVLTLLLGVEIGLAIAVALSLFSVIQRSSRAHWTLLGVMPMRNHRFPTFRSIKHYPGVAKELPNVAVMRYDASLYFANIDHFLSSVHKVIRERTVNAVVIDFTSVNAIDSTAALAVKDLFEKLKEKDVTLTLVHLKFPVRHRFYKIHLISDENFDPEDDSNDKFSAELHTALELLHRRGVVPSLPWKYDDDDDNTEYDQYDSSSTSSVTQTRDAFAQSSSSSSQSESQSKQTSSDSDYYSESESPSSSIV